MAVNRTTLWTRSTALAAALAVLTLPAIASAQDEDGHRGRMREAPGHIGGSDGARPAPQPRGDAPSWGGGRRSAQASAPAAAPAPAPEPAARRGGWSRPDPAPAAAPQPAYAGQRGGWGRADGAAAGEARADGAGRGGGWWSGARSRTPETAPAPARPAPPATADRRGAWGSRDGTDTDPRRDGTYRREDRRGSDGSRYRDGSRDGRQGSYRDQRRDGYRDGSRSGTWWEGGRDRRSDDWRRDGRREDSRHGYRGDHHRWDRDWRRDRRYDWNSYRRYNRDQFSIGFYYAPYRNYSYRRLSIGYFLDSLFLSNRYWINDPWQYRLPDVYGPYRWVRYYNDVLLVDIYSGEVVDVIYDFFW